MGKLVQADRLPIRLCESFEFDFRMRFFKGNRHWYILLATFRTKVKLNTLEFCLYCAVLLSTSLHFRTAPGKISASIVLLIVLRLAVVKYTSVYFLLGKISPKNQIGKMLNTAGWEVLGF